MSRGVWVVLAWAVLVSRGAAAGATPLADLDRLAWMAGSWRSVNGGTVAEEYWLPPAGGMMLGVGRTVGPEGNAFFEYLRIEKGKDGLLHYLASPGGRKATAFRMVEIGDRRAVFANDRHDWPTRITYWISEEGALHARVEGGPGDPVETFRWERATISAPARP